ncbi:TPA: hypothetical protein JS305_005006 [Escherichia coli]|nr:hypothetical protein [Escherichia coli]
MEPGMTVSHVARLHGIQPSLLLLKPNVRTALHNRAVAIDHYNENHPHSALGYRSTREYRRHRVMLT